MGSSRTIVIFTTVSLLAVLASGRAFAQSIGATLQGIVTDEQHGVLPGVSVAIMNAETSASRTAVTDAAGWYRATALPPGAYEVTADLTGFVSYKRTGLTLTTGQDVRIDITLRVASFKETVQVVAEAPLVDVTNNAIGTTITRKDLDSIPLVDRNSSAWPI